ncbi:hypothetical protein [Actinomadura sp. NEAU-AAG7]|uniref:hypothetical protein n=1 Tax=Actinomadura sp. NEAU-AAG7 TaxID=2839640 RepID=UPI001BE3F6E5|nr:hypothetical protein [Actinomadura sp. NEAU-AAG7]MBT2207024.1 hypothetical protein [Actinomadura sp. NEAU-AAG7]
MGVPNGSEPPPAVITAGGAFLPGSVCEPLWRVLRAELARHRADGGRVRPDVAAALDTLRAAAMAHLSASGHAARTLADIGASSPRDKALLTTGEMATALGVCDRHARRLAATERIAPAARGLWRADDVAALVAARRKG